MVYSQSKTHSVEISFHSFSMTEILREINFGHSKSAKYAIFAILEALDFNFYDFFCAF